MFVVIDELFLIMMEVLLVCGDFGIENIGFCFSAELDSDYDSRDGSDDENENSIKSEVKQKKFNKIPEETIFSKRSIIILFHFFYLNIIYKYIFC